VTSRLGRRYARALLELAREEGSPQAFGDELGRAVTVFEEPRLRPLCLSPALERAARIRNTREVVGALRLSRTVANLVKLLSERDRLALLPDIARCYETLLDAEVGRVRVTIRSAAPLAAGQRSAVVDMARRLTGKREVLANMAVEPELLGGVVLEAAGTVYDGSLRAHMSRLGKEMAKGGS
jgi:F-type H+-transporting ATPase subunit delta